MNYIDIGLGRFYWGKCFDVMPTLPDGCVDMVLCDLPYGTTQNKWDSVLSLTDLWREYKRICKGAVVLSAAQPFTSALVMSNIDSFKYQWVWEKSKPSGFLNARRRPLTSHEDINVFGCIDLYNPQDLTIVSVNSARKNKSGNGNFGIVTDKPYIQTEGNFPRSVIKFQHEVKPIHPTQKPIALWEYLIKTYTNEDMLVLDNCAGSGTTAIACENTNRRWICIEKDETYALAAVKRIQEHLKARPAKD